MSIRFKDKDWCETPFEECDHKKQLLNYLRKPINQRSPKETEVNFKTLGPTLDMFEKMGVPKDKLLTVFLKLHHQYFAAG